MGGVADDPRPANGLLVLGAWLVVSAGIALAGPVLALAFLPGRPATETAMFEGPGRSVMERTGMKLPAIAVVEVTPVDRST